MAGREGRRGSAEGAVGPVLREGRVSDAVVGVAGEGDGDGIAGAPVHPLHTVQVLGPRGEEGHAAWGGGERRDFGHVWPLQPASYQTSTMAQAVGGSPQQPGLPDTGCQCGSRARGREPAASRGVVGGPSRQGKGTPGLLSGHQEMCQVCMCTLGPHGGGEVCDNTVTHSGACTIQKFYSKHLLGLKRSPGDPGSGYPSPQVPEGGDEPCV